MPSLFQKIAAFIAQIALLITAVDEVTAKLTALDTFLDTTP